MLSRLLVARGYDVAVLTGADFGSEGAAIAAAGGVNAASTGGALGLQETAAVLRRVTGAVSGDTGLMHLATAVGTRVVALFGPTVRQFGFFPYRSPATVLEVALGLPAVQCAGRAELSAGASSVPAGDFGGEGGGGGGNSGETKGVRRHAIA